MPKHRALKGAVPVTLRVMMDAREEQARVQRILLQNWGNTLITLALNIPGEHKMFPLAMRCYSVAKKELMTVLKLAGVTLLHTVETTPLSGPVGFFVVDRPAEEIKPLVMELEEHHQLGRLFDINVHAPDGRRLRREEYGASGRSCLICGGAVWECSRNRTHSAAQLSGAAIELMQSYFDTQYAFHLANLTLKALLYEVSVTPKPGLVDRLNNGVHQDMDYYSFLNSTGQLGPYFFRFAWQGLRFEGQPEALLPLLRPIGVEAHEQMLAATGGSNTHKGLIFSLGLLCAALGLLRRGAEGPPDPGELAAYVKQLAAPALAELSEVDKKQQPTKGEQCHLQHHCPGVRGEAAAGFPSVMQHGLPTLRRQLENGADPDEAGLAALLELMVHVQDTNLMARCGPEALQELQEELRAFLQKEPAAAERKAYAGKLDARFAQQGLSPGGSADMLALCFFLYFVQQDPG